MTLVRVARYAAWCLDRHRPLDWAPRAQASRSPTAHRGSCVRRIAMAVGTDRRWFGEVRTHHEAARTVMSDLPEGESAM
jgi:hypothetical protein